MSTNEPSATDFTIGDLLANLRRLPPPQPSERILMHPATMELLWPPFAFTGDKSASAFLGIPVAITEFVQPGEMIHLHGIEDYLTPRFLIGYQPVALDPRLLVRSLDCEWYPSHLAKPRVKRNYACLSWQAANAVRKKRASI